jgi:hypothetical protein
MKDIREIQMQETSQYYDIAYHFAMFTNRSLFLTGKAGTGKTTFLKKLKEQTKKKMAIVAPTGVAAINAGGVTIHSFFQLPFSPFIPTEENKKELLSKLKMNSARRKVLYELELLVIDEISMVRADVLDEIDTILRHFRYKHNEPFGGVQMVFIGDMYQLSPVYKEEEWKMLSPYYQSIYFFDSHAIKQQTPLYIEFDKIFRQSDMEFIQLLNEVRNNSISERSYNLLQSLYKPDFKPSKDDSYITLTTHNYIADGINGEELDKLKGKKQQFEATIKGDYPEKSYPTEKVLEFKVGAKVMFLKNDKETPRRYFNGKIGEITAFEDDVILVKCSEDEESIAVEQEMWENVSYSSNSTTKQIEETVLGTFEQYPLRLAWAITIHKSQGLTFDKAIIDAGKSFAPGQVYVALSRCRSLDGMVLLSKINRQSLETDQNIIEHGKQKLSLEILDNQLNVSKIEFKEKILLSLFDFRSIVGQCNRLIDFVNGKSSSFNEETIPFLAEIQSKTIEIQDVAIRFQQQLQKIIAMNSTDDKVLQERIASAVDYFSGQLKMISEKLKKSPAITDSRANAMDYNDDLQTIFASIEEKRHIFNAIKGNFSVEQYYMAKNNLILPVFPVNSFAGSHSSGRTEARFPILYRQLADFRRKICEASNIPLYLVSSTKGLAELATYLPLNLEDMLKISGFGKATVDKYGQQFLDIILEYCRQNDLESLIHEKQTQKRERKPREKKEKLPKEKKPDTKKISFDLYKQGLSIEEIAKNRNLVRTTIEGHLAYYVKTKDIPLRDFVSEEKEEKIRKALKTNSLMSDIYASLKGEVSYGEIRMIIALKESES